MNRLYYNEFYQKIINLYEINSLIEFIIFSEDAEDLDNLELQIQIIK